MKEWSITAAPTEVEIFDGRTLEVWSYNGQVPGPTLRLRLGQTVRVHLKNELPMPTTIHWHGVRVPNDMDGVPEVTQPPVQPGETFVYEFTPKDAGTFWFHPHVRSMEQVERGLYGLLIVEDAEPLPYTREIVWVLDDWRLTGDGTQIDPNFATRSDLAHDGRWGNVIAVNGRLSPVVEVQPGERIRLRMLNSANGRVFVPDLWRLDAKLIAVDGMLVARHYNPRRFEMAPGNRLDFDITFKPEDAGRVIPVYDRWARKPNKLAVIHVLDEVVPTREFPAPLASRVPHWKGAETLDPTLEYVLNARTGGPLGVQWTLERRRLQPAQPAGHAVLRRMGQDPFHQRVVALASHAHARRVLQAAEQERPADGRTILARHGADTPTGDRRDRPDPLGRRRLAAALPHSGARGRRHDDHRGGRAARTLNGAERCAVTSPISDNRYVWPTWSTNPSTV